MRFTEDMAGAVVERPAGIVGGTWAPPTILAESVAISGEALFIAMVVLVLLAIVGIVGLAALVYLGAHLATRSRRSDQRPLAIWLWVLCTVVSIALVLALPWVWFVGVIAAPLLGAAGAELTHRIDERP